MPSNPVIDSGDLRRYRTEIPNIVYHLGLTPYELTLYNHLKRTAGANGQSRKSADTLATETGMSKGMVSKAKIGLAQPRAELSDQPLIIISPEKNKNGGKPKDVIEITDIWQENMAMFSKRSQVHPMTLQGHTVTVARSPRDLGKEPFQERTIQEEEKDTPLPPRGRIEKPLPPTGADPEAESRAEMMAWLEERIGPLATPGREGKALKWLSERTYSEEECKGCLEYLLGQEWRTTAVTWVTVQKEIGNWVRRGSPERDEPKTSSNGHKPADEVHDPFAAWRPSDDDGLTEAQIRKMHNMGPDDEILEYKYPA